MPIYTVSGLVTMGFEVRIEASDEESALAFAQYEGAQKLIQFTPYDKKIEDIFEVGAGEDFNQEWGHKEIPWISHI